MEFLYFKDSLVKNDVEEINLVLVCDIVLRFCQEHTLFWILKVLKMSNNKWVPSDKSWGMILTSSFLVEISHNLLSILLLIIHCKSRKVFSCANVVFNLVPLKFCLPWEKQICFFWRGYAITDLKIDIQFLLNVDFAANSWRVQMKVFGLIC